MRISREAGILASICIVDMVFTIALLVSGRAAEANPILGYYLDRDNGIAWFAIAKTLLFVGPLFALEVLRRRRPRFVSAMMRAGIVLYLLCYGLGVYHVNSNGRATPYAPLMNTLPRLKMG